MGYANFKFRANVADVIKAIERHTGIRNPVIEDSVDASGLVNALIHVTGHNYYIEATCTLVDEMITIKIIPCHRSTSDSVMAKGTDVQKLILAETEEA